MSSRGQRAIREAQIPQSDIAAHIGCSVSGLSRKLRGERALTLAEAAAIARFVTTKTGRNISAEDFLSNNQRTPEFVFDQENEGGDA